jgi:nucleotide-binding universal stress UspA family protein
VSVTPSAGAAPAAISSVDRVLVGVDGSAASLAALRWSLGLARRSGQSVTAVLAFTPSDAEVSPAKYQALTREAERALQDWCADTAGEASVGSMVVGGGPDALLAASGQADLLVVGTRGAGGFAHLHLGSVAHHLAHFTSVPLAIVPTGAARAPVRIVLGVDGSPGSTAAVNFCAAFAPRIGAKVLAIHAASTNANGVPDIESPEPHQDTEAMVREWVVPIEAAGAPVAVEVQRDANPVLALRRAIDAEPDTMAIVGTRGRGGFSGLRLGRVPIQLVHSSGAAVVLVPGQPHPAPETSRSSLAEAIQWPLDSPYSQKLSRRTLSTD